MGLVVSDFLDNQWATFNLEEALEQMSLCAKRLRSIACQKSVPKKETILRWVSFGEIHREQLESLLKQIKSDPDYHFVGVSDGHDYGREKSVRFLETYAISIEFYSDARDRALKRLKNPKRQVFA